MDNIKITYLGDLTCDKPLLRASEKKGYDFAPVFSKVKKKFKNSDLVVANFETVCAGLESQNTKALMRYNTPDSFVEAIADANIKLVSTANNHCLDQGIEGLKRTLDILDKFHVKHTGTYRNQEERNQICTVQVKEKKISFLSYTYSTNETNTGIVLDETNDFQVGLLKKQATVSSDNSHVKNLLLKIIGDKQRRLIKKVIFKTMLAIGVPYMHAYVDQIREGDRENIYLESVKKDIAEAKKVSDFVVLLVHAGGQFNPEPGTYCEFLMDTLTKFGADAVIENHPHVVQEIKETNKKLTAYSLGSFNLSPSADYIIHEPLPEYSIALHQYILNDTVKYTFSILKNIEDKDGNIVVWPIEDLYEKCSEKERKVLWKESSTIFERVTGEITQKFSIREEYDVI